MILAVNRRFGIEQTENKRSSEFPNEIHVHVFETTVEINYGTITKWKRQRF